MNLLAKEVVMNVFLIESNPLITSWLKLQSEALKHSFYSLTKINEAGYFISDLKPDVIVVTGEILDAEWEIFENYLNEWPEIQKIPLITMGQKSLKAVQYPMLRGHIPKPINPERFHKQVSDLLSL
jgi:hypothetical protein